MSSPSPTASSQASPQATPTGTLPGVTFVVPVFNKAPYLPRVLAAIRDQRGDFAKSYIFIDDGSSDDSLALVRDATAGWENTVIVVQDNHGSAHATNQGIARATQPFIKFVDADDLLAAHATESLLEALHASDACLAWGEVVRYRDASEIDLAARNPDPPVETLNAPLLAALRNSLFNPSQCLVRSAAARAVGGCDERIRHSQEYSLTLRLAHFGAFLKVAAPAAYLPRFVATSLSANEARQLRRVTLACANLLRDHPDLGPEIQQYACRRAAGRAWLFARRRRGAGVLSRPFWRHLRSRFPLRGDRAAFIERCAAAFADPPGA